MPDRPDEPFDEGFEPFELEDTPTGETRRAAPRPKEAPAPRSGGGRGGPPTGVPCPSCGTHNPPFNRHCDSCGARLSQAPLPVAPQPMLRTTAGARALMVLAGVILTVALLALAVNVFKGGDGTPESTTTSTTTQPDARHREAPADPGRLHLGTGVLPLRGAHRRRPRQLLERRGRRGRDVDHLPLLPAGADRRSDLLQPRGHRAVHAQRPDQGDRDRHRRPAAVHDRRRWRTPTSRSGCRCAACARRA